MIVINLRSLFTGVRAAEIFFEPHQLHLELADLLEKLSLIGLTLLFALALLASGEQLAGAIQQLPLLLAHLNRMDDVIVGDFLDRLAATHSLHGNLGLHSGCGCVPCSTPSEKASPKVGAPFRQG